MPLLLYCCQSVSHQKGSGESFGTGRYTRPLRLGNRLPSSAHQVEGSAHCTRKHTHTRVGTARLRATQRRKREREPGRRVRPGVHTSTHLWWRHVVAVVVAWSHGGWWLVIPQQERGRHHRHGRHSHAEPCGCGRELQMPDRKEETRGCRQTDARVGSRQNAHQARRQAGGLVDASSTVWFAAVATQTSSSSPSQRAPDIDTHTESLLTKGGGLQAAMRSSTS